MNSKKYISDAVVTESNDFKSIAKRIQDPAVLKELQSTVAQLIEANHKLDLLKKLIFYNKNLMNIELGKEKGDLKVSKRLVRLTHATVGLSTESGEMLEQLAKALGKEKVDLVNLGEEQGDLFWYCAIMCDELGMTFEELMTKNIKKLKERFKGKFTEARANSRDLKKERKILETNHKRKAVKKKAKKKK